MEIAVSIRAAGIGEENALAQVGQATFLESYAGILPAQDIALHCEREHSPSKYRALLADGVSKIWIAEAVPGAAPVGYLVLTEPDLPLVDIAKTDREIKRIYLLHRFQGAGLGGRLLQRAKLAATSAGACRILLGVYSENFAAIAFYRKHQFVAVGTRQFCVGANTYHDLILGADLAS